MYLKTLYVSNMRPLVKSVCIQKENNCLTKTCCMVTQKNRLHEHPRYVETDGYGNIYNFKLKNLVFI